MKKLFVLALVGVIGFFVWLHFDTISGMAKSDMSNVVMAGKNTLQNGTAIVGDLKQSAKTHNDSVNVKIRAYRDRYDVAGSEEKAKIRADVRGYIEGQLVNVNNLRSDLRQWVDNISDECNFTKCPN